MAEEKASFSKFEKFIQPLVKMSQFKVVRAIMAAGMATIPFTIVGSLLLVIGVIPEAFPALEPFFNSTILRINDLFMTANTATMGTLALYFCLVVGYELTKIQRDESGINVDPLNGALLGMFAFLICIPQLFLQDNRIVLVESITSDESIVNGLKISGGVERLGTSGIFIGIIMAIIGVSIYCFCVRKNWVIKMPEAVPPGVARSFSALIPTAVIAFVVLLINGLLILLGTDLFSIIYIPFKFVAGLTSSWVGIMIIYFLISALWIVGIHGSTILGSILTPVILSNMAENAAGANIPFAGEFGNAYSIIGGTGATLGLVIFIAFFAKSDQLKILGKASLVPSFFNINEPILLGLPIVYNPYIAVPFFLAPMASASLAYFAIKFQIVRPMIAQVPWPTPIGISAFMGSGGDWKAPILAVLCAVLAFLIYFPFIKIYDNKLMKEEKTK